MITKYYKVIHPKFQVIYIGQQFELNNGNIVRFLKYDENIYHGKIRTSFSIGGFWYSENLLFGGAEYIPQHPYHVKNSMPLLKLKDKIKLL